MDPRPNVIRLQFTYFCNTLECLSLASLSIHVFQVLHSKVGSCPYTQTLDSAEIKHLEKHPSLLQEFLNYDRKKFFRARPTSAAFLPGTL